MMITHEVVKTTLPYYLLSIQTDIMLTLRRQFNRFLFVLGQIDSILWNKAAVIWQIIDAKDIYHSTKSQIVELFESPSLNQQTPASVYVVDLSVVMRTSAARLKCK